MELITKQGYKQTEVGLIPEDWIYCSVGEAIENDFIDKPIDGNHGNIHPKKSDFVESGIPFIMANNVYGNKVHIYDCSYITKKQADSLQKGFSYAGDVLLTHKGTVGNVAIVGELPCDYIMLTPQVTYYRTKQKLNNKYLKGYFESNLFQKVLSMLSGGGTRAYIGIVKQKELPLIIPPTLIEQKAIANALSDVDSLIASLEQTITKKKAIKQGAMQQLLTPPHKGGKRLPGFSGEWAEKKLGAFCELTSSKRIFEHDYVSNGIPFYRGKEISLLLENKPISEPYYITEDKYQSLHNQFGAPQKNDILITAVGTLGNVYLIPDNNKFYFKDGNLIWLRKSKGIDSLFFSMQIGNHKKQILDNAIGSSQKALTIVVLKEQIIPVPLTLEEQQAIAQILSDMDAEITQLETKKVKYQDIKQGMMQELLTGKTRLI